MRNRFLIGPLSFVCLLSIVLLVWGILEPATVISLFDADGYAPVELATLPFFALIVPIVWWRCPFSGSRLRRTLLCLAVSIVAIMAIVKELDGHALMLEWVYPEFVKDGSMIANKAFRANGAAIGGTPFKMPVLKCDDVPLGMKCLILAYFVSFFGLFAIGFLYLARTWIKGIFTFDAAAWAWGSCCASGLVVHISDRLPSWLGHAYGLTKHSVEVTHAQSLCTALEEGGEFMLALLALQTIWLAYRQLQKRTEPVDGIIRA